MYMYLFDSDIDKYFTINGMHVYHWNRFQQSLNKIRTELWQNTVYSQQIRRVLSGAQQEEEEEKNKYRWIQVLAKSPMHLYTIGEISYWIEEFIYWMRKFFNLRRGKCSTSSKLVCAFITDRKTKMATLAYDRLRYFRLLLLKPLSRFLRNLTGSKITTSSTKLVF